MKIDLGPMPPYPGRVPRLFKLRGFWVCSVLNVIGVSITVYAAHLDAITDSDFLLALMCANLAVQLVSSVRIAFDVRRAFRDHRELLASWETLRQVREQIKAEWR